MSHQLVRQQVITNVGQVLGQFGTAKAGQGVRWHGYMFSNSAGAGGSVGIWLPNAAPGSGNLNLTIPGNTGANTLTATIQVPANSSKEFYADAGILFPDGAFFIASAATVTGIAIYS